MDLRAIARIGKLKLAGGALAATLALGGGAALVAAAPGSVGVAPGAVAAASGTPAAATPTTAKTSACAREQQLLAQNLGIGVDALQSAEKTTLNQLIDQRLAAKKITPAQAQTLHDRVNNAKQVCANLGAAHPAKRRAALGKVRRDELSAVAQKFQMTEQQLVTDLRTGKTLAQEAQAHNVSTDDLKATMRGALKTDLDQAVANKMITADQENKALAAFDKHADTLINRQWGPKQQH
ncbi:MAG TPA: hypothetical protein VFL91_31695 [Thermomicrobiales bacterium]|nr:hypothetical protein [Thermomicrobiales bacterium]